MLPVIIVSTVIIALIIIVFAFISLNNTYENTIRKYETFTDDIPICEDCIDTFSKMKFYKNSSNYIIQIKRTIIENYCAMNQYKEAKNYLDRNYEKALDDMYAKIDNEKKEYEDKQFLEENSADDNGNYNDTDALKENSDDVLNNSMNTYASGGVGGCDNGYYVIETLKENYPKSSFQDFSFIFPIWNRNEAYYEQMRKDIMQGINYDYENSGEFYGLIDYSDISFYVDSVTVSISDYENYIRYMYNRDDTIQDIRLYECVMVAGPVNDSKAVYKKVIAFETNDRWFYGGILTEESGSSVDIIP